MEKYLSFKTKIYFNKLTHIICIIFIFHFASNLSAEELLVTKKSWDGGNISYPKGETEITSFILSINEGDVPEFHCHPVPTMGYVLKGNVEVETIDGKKTILKEGESAVEVMRTVYRSKALNGPAQIIVFYAGADGIPNSVLPKDDSSHQYCNETGVE